MKKLFISLMLITLIISCASAPDPSKGWKDNTKISEKIKFLTVKKEEIKIPRKVNDVILGGMKIRRDDNTGFYYCFQKVVVLDLKPGQVIRILDNKNSCYAEFNIKTGKTKILEKYKRMQFKNAISQFTDKELARFTLSPYSFKIGSYNNFNYYWHLYKAYNKPVMSAYISIKDIDKVLETKHIKITSDFVGTECRGSISFFISDNLRKGIVGSDGNLYVGSRFDPDYIVIDKYILQD